MTDSKKQNEVAATYFESLNSDFAERETDIVAEIARATGFQPRELLGRSTFWNSDKIGAFHYSGEFDGKEAVLKVQGIKPQTSEIYMLESFENSNSSNLIRPPHLYASIPWDDSNRYEALIMEDVKGDKIISNPTNESEVAKFFEVYEDYKKNCLKEPWLDKPDKPISELIQANFDKWLKASEEIHSNHPHRKPEDAEIIQKARDVLINGYQGIEPEFQHGHFSADDLYKVDDEVVLLSNLYWSWRVPMYDAIFAYHWYIYRLANLKDDLSPAEVDQQRQLWLSKIDSLPQAKGDGAKLLDLALLERETAGLMMDALTVETDRPISDYIVDSTRQRVLELIKKHE